MDKRKGNLQICDGILYSTWWGSLAMTPTGGLVSEVLSY
jgi:hypothetical protein